MITEPLGSGPTVVAIAPLFRATLLVALGTLLAGRMITRCMITRRMPPACTCSRSVPFTMRCFPSARGAPRGRCAGAEPAPRTLSDEELRELTRGIVDGGNVARL